MRLTSTTSALGVFVIALVLVAVSFAGPPGRVVRVGLLYPIVPNFDPAANPFDRELVEGLRELRYVPGRDIVFEFRSAAEGGPTRAAAAGGGAGGVAGGDAGAPGTIAALEAAKVTKTVPIVMVGTSDPVETGLVASLAHPGGNVTGLAINGVEMAAKRVQLLKEAVPKCSRVAVLWNSNVKSMTLGFQMIEHAAPTLGVVIESIRVAGSSDFDQAFEALERARPDGLIVLYGPLRGDDLPRIVEFVARHRIPTVFEPARACAGGA
jgi:putative ABC transport system substrate-binding protein